MEIADQMVLFEVSPAPPQKPDPQRRNWENGFQRWSDEAAQDGSNPLGICGYSSMCDYCDNNTYGRPCVRALNEMCKEKRISIDYSNRNYEDIWDWRINK